MTKTSLQVVLVAAACLGIAGALRPVTEPTIATSSTSSSTTEDGQQGTEVLITNSGYMVAVG